MISRLRRLARYSAPLPVLAIVVLSLVPGHERPSTGFAGQVEHLVAYGLTAAGLAFAFPRRSTAIVVGMAVLAGLLEAGQLWVPGRTARLVDVAASAVGALVGGLLAGLANATVARPPPSGPPRRG